LGAKQPRRCAQQTTKNHDSKLVIAEASVARRLLRRI
jgi:hypothetical protein